MGYQYNDAQMMLATQIAYLDFNGQDVSVGQLVQEILQYGHCVDGEWLLYEQYQNSPQCNYLKKQLEVAGNIQQLTENGNGLDDSWKEWKVVNTCNDQDETGFYGCLIDTGNGHAIIGCRGSESYDSNQVVKDWIIADVGLLDSTLTTQQERAEKYMEQLYYEFGDKYDSFSLTGHSLGGNLAQHMTIHAPADMRDKIDHCISFDGPGFSQEYIDNNRGLIEKTDDCMDHYQWSWVSSLLEPLPGVQSTVIRAHDDERYIPEDGAGWGNIVAAFFRHDVHNVELDENGNIQEGEESVISKLLGPVSKYIEHLGEDTFITPFTPLPKVVHIVYLYKAYRDVIIKFYEVSKSVKEGIVSVYYNYIAPSVGGEYEIRTSAVSAYKSELKNAKKQLDEVNSEIEQITRSWHNWTASGSYYRSQLNMIKNGLEFDIRALNSLADASEKIASTYSGADSKVENLFS